MISQQNYYSGGTYNGEIAAGSLMIPESRRIAALLLEKPDEETWKRLVLTENILQKRSMDTAKRQAKLIRNRLSLMQPALWEMARDGSGEIATQALMAAAVKHSRMLGDFMDKVIREHNRTFKTHITHRDWDEFLEICKTLDPAVGKWTETTLKKLAQVVIRILAEGKYIENTRSRRLLPVSVAPEIKRYLIEHNEQYVLRCMQVSQH